MPRLLLIGWDSADWRLLRPLLAAGKLPHLQSLIDRGTSGNLATLQPILSPILWTSIATGKRPPKHGILGFIEADPENHRIRPVTNLNRKTKAVWNILGQNGLRSNVVGWWPSHPAEPIRGAMVSNAFQVATRPLDQPWPLPPGTVHPARLREPLARLRLHPHEIDGNTLLPFVPKAPEINQAEDRRLGRLAQYVAENASVHAAATGLIQLEPWDFFAVYYDGLDHFGHVFMPFHPPRQAGVTERDFELYRGVMETACIWHDQMLGVLLELAGPETRILLMSDHGFHPNHLRLLETPNEPDGPTAEHRQFGIFVLAGPGIAAGKTIRAATVLDICPTVLHGFGLPMGEDMDGKVLIEAFVDPGPVQRIPSWDEVAGEDGRHPPDTRLDPQDAEAALRQLAELGYADPPSADEQEAAAETAREQRYHLAQAWMDAARYEPAAQALEELGNRWPDESRFGVKLLHCRLAQGDAARSRAALEQLAERRREAARKAVVELEELVRPHGDTPPEKWPMSEQHRLRRLRGRAVLDRGALRYFEALVQMVEGNWENAESGLRELLSSAAPGRRLDLHLQLGQIAGRRRRWDEAETHYRQALGLDEETAAAHLGLARSLLFRRRPVEAAAHARQAVEFGYHDPRAHHLYGAALVRCGYPDAAEAAFLEAIRQAPRFAQAHRRLAGLYAGRKNHPAKALHHLEQALRATEIPAAAPAEPSHPADEIPLPAFQRRGRAVAPPEEVVTVVTGLPRSGTSLLMQMLVAGGLPALTDGKRTADASNSRGYFEFEPAKRLAQDASWLEQARGKVVKVVAPLVQHLPAGFDYRVVWVERDLEEVLASQDAMLRRMARRRVETSPDALARVYRLQVARCRRRLLQQPRLDAIAFRYLDLLADPAAAAGELARFMDRDGLNQEAMAAAVAPELRRERRAAK